LKFEQGFWLRKNLSVRFNRCGFETAFSRRVMDAPAPAPNGAPPDEQSGFNHHSSVNYHELGEWGAVQSTIRGTPWRTCPYREEKSGA